MANITLFDAASQVREAVERIDPETGEIDESWANSLDLFKAKAVACVAYAKDEATRLKAGKEMLKQMQEQLAAKERANERFKAYMADCMRNSGVHEIKDDTGLYFAKLEIGRDESVEIDADAQFPASLCLKPAEPKPSKKLIGDAIKAGEPIKGARLVRDDRLTIR